MSKRWEKEFLRLAGTWLVCRHRILHGPKALIGCKIPFDLAYDILGTVDSFYELELLVKEAKGGR